MKGKMKFAVVAVLLATFMAKFTGEALAANKPNWVGTTWTASLMTNENANNQSHNYWLIKIAVTHKNNSNNRIITAFYNKSMTFSANMRNPNNPNKTPLVKGSLTSDRVNKVELYPGQSQILNYFLPLSSLLQPPSNSNWQTMNAGFSKLSGGDINKAFTNRKLSYDCGVRSE